MRRRNFLIGAGSIATAGVGIALMPDTANAEINIQEFNIPDESKEIVDPVSSARLEVNAQYQWEAGKVPTKVVLRLEATRANEYTQIAATDWRSSLDKSQSGTTTLKGNLLDCPNLTAPDLSPTDTGESKSVDLSIRLKMSVYRDGNKLSENSVEDMVSIDITKGTASASIELGGQGSVSITESSPSE